MEQQVNLYQPILGAEKRLFSAHAIAAGLGMLLACLGVLAAFAAWRTTRVERVIATIEQQQTAELALAERSAAAMRPRESLSDLDAMARALSAEIAAREVALDVVHRGIAAPGAGFAARLEALAKRQIDGLWLRRIVLATGDSRLAVEGAATEPRLVPAYLAALGEERALDGARFDHLALRRARPEEAPAQTVFELGAPGLALPVAEKRQ